MSYITFAELISSQRANLADALTCLADSKEDDAYVFLSKDVNPLIDYASYLKLPKQMLHELAIKVRTKEFNNNLNYAVVFLVHSRKSKKEEKVFSSFEELELQDWEIGPIIENQTYCIFNWDNSSIDSICLSAANHPLHSTYVHISHRNSNDRIRKALTISKMRISIDTLLIRADCKLILPKKVITDEEILYSMYPSLDPNHEDYNEKIVYALKGNKAIVTDKRYADIHSFHKKFANFMQEQKHHLLDSVIKNVGYVASPMKEPNK